MDKQQKIVGMFDQIAGTYDLANRVLSFGVDRNWRKVACDEAFALAPKALDLIVDVACGTGDMTAYWHKRAATEGVTLGRIVGIDPSVGMLEVAKSKNIAAEFVVGEAKALPIPSESADIVSISYGLRNVVDRPEGLREFYRILKPGGLLVILEFTKLEHAGIGARLREFYMKRILPFVGGLLSRNFAAYRYLPDSIDLFLTKQMLTDELAACGFRVHKAQGYSLEISTLFIAQKP